jgi:predicted nucleic acid-binding protein
LARLIDTSVFVAMERDARPIDDVLIAARTERVALASITVSELLVGVERADTLERRDRRSTFVETILRNFVIYPLDLEVARVHARLSARLESLGLKIGPYDSIVAATALQHGYDVLTFNVREFERVQGLGVLRPDW